MAPAPTRGEKGEGDAAFASWQSNLRRLPFLRRNLRKVVRSLVENANSAKDSLRMGAILSRPKRAHEPSDDEADEPPRPAKRRRNSAHHEKLIRENGSSLSQVSSSTAEATSAFMPNDDSHQDIPRRNAPATGLGKEKPFPVDSILPKVPERSLRVSVLGIKYNAPSLLNIPSTKVGQSFKCRCMIGIFTIENENSSEYNEVFRATQTATIQTVLEDGKPGAQVILPGPFIIKAEDLYVNKKDGICLGDFYRLHMWFKPIGYQQSWPPLNTAPLIESTVLADILSKERATLNNVGLYCATRFLLEPDKQTEPLELYLTYGTRNKRSEKVTTPYALDLRVTWSLPSILSAPKSNSFKVNTAPNSNGENPVQALPTIDQEKTPVVISESSKRAQRRRTEATTYNLKALSDIARGDQPKVHKTRETKSAQRASEQGDEIRIIYTLGRADAADLGIEQKTVVPGFSCAICREDQGTLEKLRHHFHSQHSHFKFHLRRSHPPRIQFFVEFSTKLIGIEPARTVQIGKPRTLFDLNKFIDGDRSWEKSRHGPQHNHWPKHLANRRLQQHSPSSSPTVSRQSSPNTSLDTPEAIPETRDAKAAFRFRRPEKVCVPKTLNQNLLYHPITKRPLVAGEEIDNSDDTIDEGWLNQKHRDIIMDYTNVTDTEKDYIIRWNPYITSFKLSCDKFMPQIVVRFVVENTLWFLADNNRVREFCKHTEALILRGTIDFECWAECMEMLKKAEENTSKEEIDKAKKAEMPIWDPTQQRGFMDCICGHPINYIDAPNRILCSGVKCKDPYFHPQCVKEAVIDERGNITNYEALESWKCDSCKEIHDEGTVPRCAGSFFAN